MRGNRHQGDQQGAGDPRAGEAIPLPTVCGRHPAPPEEEQGAPWQRRMGRQAGREAVRGHGEAALGLRRRPGGGAGGRQGRRHEEEGRAEADGAGAEGQSGRGGNAQEEDEDGTLGGSALSGAGGVPK